MGSCLPACTIGDEAHGNDGRFPPFRSPFGQLNFYVPHCKERQRLSHLVLKGGGALTDVAGDDHILHLIPDSWVTTHAPVKWAIAAQFVEDCVAAQKLLAFEDYLVSSRPATTRPARRSKPCEHVFSETRGVV